MTAQWPSDWEASHDPISNKHYVLSESLCAKTDSCLVGIYVPLNEHGEPDLAGLLLRLNTWQQMRDDNYQLRSTLSALVTFLDHTLPKHGLDWLAMALRQEAHEVLKETEAARGEGVE